MIKRKKHLLKYLLTDYISANIAWFIYDFLRFFIIGRYLGYTSISTFLSEPTLIIEQIFAPFCWLIIYYYSGYYNNTFQISRISEMFTTFISVIIGALLIFFVFILDDLPPVHIIYYKMVIALIGVQFICTYIPRAILTYRTAQKIHHRQLGFNTLIIGTGKRARQLADELNGMKRSIGHIIVGFCRSGSEDTEVEENEIIGNIDNIETIISQYKVESILIAKDIPNYQTLYDTLRSLFRFNIPIQITADRYDILTGNAKMSTIYGMPMIHITGMSMKAWEKNIKQTSDIIISFLCLLLTSPLLLYAAWRIKRESTGPVIYRQERIGRYGKPFYIYKFRSMHTEAEKEAPQLASENDPRITPFGKFMRKYRIDELPQFWNVIKGDMSIVGPRPERKYYVDKIIEKAPFYYTLQCVRPGITSWGMVKYGYADTVDKMVERMYYDIIYIESMSLLVDIKIMIYTIQIIVTGKGI